MKKIMIAAAIVCATVASQAAVVTWGATAMTDGKGNEISAAGQITGYLYTLTATDYATYATMDAATLSKTVGAAFEAGTLGTVEVTGSNTYNRKRFALDLIGKTEYSAGETAYALLLYVDSANEMYMANVAQTTFAAPQNRDVTDLGTTLGGFGSSAGATSWQAVPEPTSGLLLLVGMGALALRRKRV